MSWSQIQHSEDLYDQIIVLVGSTIRIVGGLAGVFVLANAAFDPQSSSEYTLYQLNEVEANLLLSGIRERVQPGPARPFVVEDIPSELTAQLSEFHQISAEESGEKLPELERCSIFVSDPSGILGVLHSLRIRGTEHPVQIQRDNSPETTGANEFRASNEALLLVVQFAAGLRSALRAQTLVKEQRRLAAIFQQSAEGILSVDLALRILDFNPAMERLTGWREFEVVGRFYYDVLRPKDRQGHELGLQGSPILQAFAGQQVVDREMVIVARDGQHFDVSVTASRVYSVHGEPTIGILNVRDITRLREQEEQRSTFISVISHELQTPIAIIKGYASTLARTDAILDPEALRTRLRAIEEEADRLNKLVGNLLYASRIQAGGLQMDIVPLDLAYLIERVAERQRIKNPGASIQLDLPARLPTVMADRERIEEVLQNLLDNAIKYSPDKAQITVSCQAMSDEVITSVSDRGMGIALREQTEI
ncbi:MAG TPA: PAS domain S-box protein, partial [Ktedonobacteraceae bacterium]|nr:PAS domain S-box protein [Ktedonobacteraceae bacterium]